MSSQVLSKMLELIKTGQLSHEDVIEEMINNGLLPVDVTEIGKIPISVGTFDKNGFGKMGQKSTQPPLLRLQNLRARRPTPNTPRAHSEMIDVDITDPDGDFENMSENLESGGKGVDPGLSEPEAKENPKDIEVLDSMMKLFDQVQIFLFLYTSVSQPFLVHGTLFD
jgi:hypothetical protein